MSDSPWAAADARLRQVKRATFAEMRRGVKIVRHRMSNTRVAATNVLRKLWRRAVAAPARIRQRLRRLEKARGQLRTYQAEWALERQIGRLTRGSEPIIVGPWLSEVGYEVLYWIPFIRWVQTRYDVSPSRFVIVTRGGAAAWYADISPRAVEIFDLMPADVFTTRNAQRGADGSGTLKQFDVSAMDTDIIARVRQRIGAADARVLHPSLLYRLFHQFWLGSRPQGFYDAHTRHARLTAPAVALPDDLPSRYVAMKFYTATSLPPTDAVRRTLRSLVLSVAARTPVVMLDTGITFDDHGEHSLDPAAGVYTLKGRLDPRDNLAVQAALIARADAFVGTCGALAWLAPMLGVDTTAVMADPRFLHHHLQVARRVYQRIGGAGRFTTLDIGAFEQLGLTPELHFTHEPTA